jgi:hypothetical protein
MVWSVRLCPQDQGKHQYSGLFSLPPLPSPDQLEHLAYTAFESTRQRAQCEPDEALVFYQQDTSGKFVELTLDAQQLSQLLGNLSGDDFRLEKYLGSNADPTTEPITLFYGAQKVQKLVRHNATCHVEQP